MDKDSYVNEKFMVSGKLTKAGQEFMQKMEDYRNEMLSLIGDSYPNVA